MLQLIAGATIKGAVVILVAIAVNRTLLRRRPAAARHAMWSAALAAQVLLLIAAPAMPVWNVPLVKVPVWISGAAADGRVEPSVTPRGDFGPAALPAAVDDGAAAIPVTARAAGEGSAPTAAPTPTESNAAGAITTSATTNDVIGGGADVASAIRGRITNIGISAALTALWVVGALLVLLRFVAGTVQVARLARASERVEDGGWLSLAQRTANRLRIARPLTLLRGSRLGVPVTWGIVYPVVLLPEEADEWPEERRELVLVHEMAHVKRLDALTQMVAQLAEALFWFNPFVWYAARQARLERERACDDYVLLSGTRPSFYADELLGMVGRLGSAKDDAAAPAFAALAMARRGEFEGRLLAILDPGARRASDSRSGLATAVAALALAFPLAALHPFSPPGAAEAAVIEQGSTVSAPRSAASRTPTVSSAAADRAADARASRAAFDFLSAAANAGRTGESGVRDLRILGDTIAFTLGTHTVSTLAVSCATDGDADSRPSGRHATSIAGDDGTRFAQYVFRESGHCLHATMLGAVAFTADEREVALLPRGARLHLLERSGGTDREITFVPAAGGAVARQYRVNGRDAALDAEAAAWLARAIPELIREAGIDARARVGRLRRGGVAPVLDEIGRMRSADGKRAYYQHLLAGSLTVGEVAQIREHARAQLGNSSEELAAVLALTQRHPAVDTGRVARPATNAERLEYFESVVDRTPSPGDRQALLRREMATTDREMLLAIMQRVAELTSDGDKSALLRIAIPRYITSDDDLRSAFFRAVGTLHSSGDMYAVLMATAPRAKVTCEDAIRETIAATRQVSSDGDRASVLLHIARSGMLTTRAVRKEFAESAATLTSDGDYTAVMSYVLKS